MYQYGLFETKFLLNICMLQSLYIALLRLLTSVGNKLQNLCTAKLGRRFTLFTAELEIENISQSIATIIWKQN